MTSEPESTPVTILFTSLVNSGELLQAAGDESAQRIFQAHNELLQKAVAAHGGETVKWLGDGLMVAFTSAADAVGCSITMQQAARRAEGEDNLEIRVGLNVGEAFRDESDYFGTPVVVAKRLCDRADAGQILCSTLVAGLLAGRQAFSFRDLGDFELKGITEPVGTSAVLFDADEAVETATLVTSAAREASAAPAAPVTILFTDLVSSTELLQKAGDERAQRIFDAHHRLLQETVAAHGGHEVKWLGDGLMVAFPSAADAVRCAIAMQQSSRRPVAGERLGIRVGLNVGELLHEESDYFGTPVVVARALCDGADAGQILCSTLVAGLLAGRQAFNFQDQGQLTLKGLPDPVAASEVVYEVDQPAALLSHPPFVGRGEELEKLDRAMAQTKAGQGGLVTLVGEPGIGKTRVAEEFVETARREGAVVLWGHCYEGEWAPPYGPFAEAIEEYCGHAQPDELRQDLGAGAGPVARLVPAVRERLPDLPEPESLQPDEERFRLLDAVSQLFSAVAVRTPLVVVLDDLHWADKDTIAMLRHVARFVPRQRILLLATYRDVELDRQHPLSEALGTLRRETRLERVVLKGLGSGDVGEFLATISEQDAPSALVDRISSETDGNPFFLREVLLHLVETGAIYEGGGRWASDAAGVEDLGIPESVRQVIGNRLSRLSDDANRFLTAASAFNSVFRFEVAANVSGLAEMPALDAVDEALEAQLLRAGGEPDTYLFAHNLLRNTLYTEQNPSRQVRLHRRIAEAMEQVYGERAVEHAPELAYQYHRSAALPGAERGVDYALAAAERGDAAYAHDDVATFLRIALELLPEGDDRRPRLLGRVGQALAWTLDFDEALKTSTEAADLVAASESEDAAADYLSDAARTAYSAGFAVGAFEFAAQGLRYAGDRRDATWARLMTYELLRAEAEDPDNPGMPLDSPERRQITEIEVELPPEQRLGIVTYYGSRAEILAGAGEDDAVAIVYLAGEYRRGLERWQSLVARHEQRGQIANLVSDWAQIARCHNALGDFSAAQEAYDRGVAVSARLAGASPQALQIFSAGLDLAFTREPDKEEYVSQTAPLLQQPAVENNWAFAALLAVAALANAGLGHADEAVGLLGTATAPLERAPGWAPNYTLVACLCAAALWVLGRTDHIEVFERNLREKVIEPDFRFPMQDGRLAMAQLSALQGRYDEAVDWFGQAKAVLDEQGARPLRAIAELNEAEMYLRRGGSGDPALARPLYDSALQEFNKLGMPGWTRRAEQLGTST